jgi:hypothetical protein
MKVDEKDVPSGTVLRDLEEVYRAFEPALAGHRTGNVREPDRMYRSYDDVAVIHSVAPAYFHMAALPDSYGAGDFASPDSLAQLLREDHLRFVLLLRDRPARIQA